MILRYRKSAQQSTAKRVGQNFHFGDLLGVFLTSPNRTGESGKNRLVMPTAYSKVHRSPSRCAEGFDEMRCHWQNQRKDPDDVFFHARDRKQQIKEQIKELQKSLDRQQSKRKGLACKKRRG
jgi:hypothetical protein